VALVTILLLTQTVIAVWQERSETARRGAQPGAQAFVERAMSFDADKDGKLSEQELTKMAESFRLDGPRRPDGGPGRFGMAAGSDLDKPPLAKDDGEARILAVLDEMTKGGRYLAVSPTDGRLLRQLAEAMGAKRVVELGTSTGYSAIWLALALRATGGKLYTHEINAERIRMARENFKKAGLDGIITIIVGDAHETVRQHTGPIDIVFLDADKQGYVDYLDKLLPLVRPGGLILAHNMRRPAPDPRYIEAITTNPDLDTTFVLMEGAGIGVTIKKRSE
jgi:predicted O-methyltransferase YrrM